MEVLADRFKHSKKTGRAGRPWGEGRFKGCADTPEKLLVAPTEGVFVVQKGVIRRCNLFLSEMCGYRPEEVTDTLFASFFDAAAIPTVESAVRNAAAGKSPAQPEEARLVAKDGRRMTVRLTARACIFSGQPATVVVLAEAPAALRPEPETDSPEQWFASEEEELPLSVAVDG